MQKYAVRKDDYLRPENKRLRGIIENMQSEGYFGELICAQNIEVTKLTGKILRLEKACDKYKIELSLKGNERRKISDLKWEIKILETGENEYKRRISRLEDALFETGKRLDNALAENQQLNKSVSELTGSYLELEGQNKKLTSQINRDYTNSSIPSSRCVNHGTIHNGREKTGKKPGGQPGHKGHLRKKFEPTQTKILPPPCSCALCKGNKMRATGKTRTRQVVGVKFLVSATNMISYQFLCEDCGEYFYSEFPEGVVNEMNYDTSIKTLASMPGSYCNISIDKITEVLSELTDRKLKLSKGAVNNFMSEFSIKASEKLAQIGNDIRMSPVMNTDATGSRLNGKYR